MILNRSIPSSEWEYSLVDGNRLLNPIVLFNDAFERQSLEKKGWLPTGAGVVVETRAIHSYENKLSDINSGFLAIDLSLISLLNIRVKKFLSEPMYNDLKVNLEHYRDVYAKASQQDLKRLPEYTYTLETSPEFQSFYKNAYLPFVQQKLEDVNSKLANF
jgi:hypothetical protein